MLEENADKIAYWQHRQREAMQRLAYMLTPAFMGADGYYGADDNAYVVAWQKQHALAYRQVIRHRGF